MTLPSSVGELLTHLKAYSDPNMRPSRILSTLKQLQADSTMKDEDGDDDLGVAEEPKEDDEETAEEAESDSSALQELSYAWGLLQAYEERAMANCENVCNRLSDSIFDMQTAILNGDLHGIDWFAKELLPLEFKIEIAKVLVRQLKLYKVTNNLDLFERIVDEDPYILNKIKYQVPE